MQDDLKMLGSLLDETLDQDIIEIKFKDNSTGVYTRLEEMTDGIDLQSDKENTVPAFNIKTQCWEILDLTEIESAETVVLLHDTES